MADFEENARSILKMTSSSKPGEVCFFYIRGIVFGCKPGELSRPLFHLEGFSSRHISDQHETLYHILTREVVLYKHLTSEKILQAWENPFNGKDVEVMHITNDPVNIPLPLKVWTPFAEAMFPKPGPCSKFVSILFEMFLQYPNPVSPEKYPDSSAGPVYDGAEFFHFIALKGPVQSSDVTRPAVLNTWFRISQWLPWMQMGMSEGRLLYTAGCQKTADSQPLFELAPDVMEVVKAKYPEYLQPPRSSHLPMKPPGPISRK